MKMKAKADRWWLKNNPSVPFLVGTKTAGTAGEILKGAIGESAAEGVKNGINAVSEAASQAVEDIVEKHD